MDEKKGNQLWDCFEPVFEGYDPDSSPFVWEYVYSKIYFEDDWQFWKKRMGFEDVKNSEALKKKVLSDEVLKRRKNRKIAYVGQENPDFGGETDFNFNESNYKVFKEKINDDKELLATLEMCSKRHHALENFSLMPRTGNLQSVKGRKKRGIKIYDRLDRFIWLLNGYFTKEKGIENEVFTGTNAHDANKQILKDYLDSFCDGGTGNDQTIYNYCLAIYKMDNKKWVKRMIKNGEKDMKGDPDDVKAQVEEYMKLANEYWDTKLKKYPAIYNIAYDEEIRRSAYAIAKINDEIERIDWSKKKLDDFGIC